MKLKKSIFGIIVAAVCTLCVFNLVTCGEKNSGKDTPVYYTVTFYCNTGLEEDSVQKQVEKGKIAADYASKIVNDRISVGEYSVSIRIAAEKFENEVLNANTVSSERYAVNGDGFSATIHYVNADNVGYVYSVYVNRYGYVTGVRKEIERNGESETKTPLYVLSSIQYE